MVTIDLTGRRALVTGGARGIGAGIVRVLAEAGARVAFTHLGSERGSQPAADLVAQLTAAGRAVYRYSAAGQDMPAMQAAVAAAAEQMGGLDILVPGVGMNWVAPLPELELDAWQRALDINLTSAYIAIKCAYPWLEQAGHGSVSQPSGRADVVIIGSSGIYDGGGGGIHYAAAKAGLEGIVHGLMREFPRCGIRVNIVHPCVVDTDLLRERYDTEEKRARLAAQVPLGRLARPEDIGYLVAFLCSDLGGFICGQSLLVDGGRTMWKQS
jgi:NAD(P)-dependent dehydrogenase (short-subunit alcohol dehydrogenase family)